MVEVFEISYLRFREIENPGRKTKKVYVEQNSTGFVLGVIKWYSRWRQYCFYPTEETIFNSSCLRIITDVVTAMTREHRANLK